MYLIASSGLPDLRGDVLRRNRALLLVLAQALRRLRTGLPEHVHVVPRYV